MNAIFSDSLWRLKEKISTLNEIVHIFMKHNQKKEVFLKVFSDSLVGSYLFPADVLLMSRGLQLIPPRLSIPYWKSFCLFLVLPFPDSTQLPSWVTAILWSFPTAIDLILTGDQFALLSVTAILLVILHHS